MVMAFILLRVFTVTFTAGEYLSEPHAEATQTLTLALYHCLHCSCMSNSAVTPGPLSPLYNRHLILILREQTEGAEGAQA